MGLQRIADIAGAYNNGRHWSGFMRRGGPSMTSGIWTDMSYAAGIPVANYYASAPLAAAVLNANEGILHGPNAAPLTKYLHKALLLPVTAIGQAVFMVLDLVLFYPFVDGDGGDQAMDNTVPIPRYGGEGCRLMLVSQGAGVSVASNTIITYTNSQGVSGRQVTVFTNNAATAGQIISGPAPGAAANASAGGPFVPLANGDTGIRSVDGINMQTGAGGIFAAVIAKPLGTISMQGSETSPIEVDYARDRLGMASFADGAYLSMVGHSSATAAPATLHAQIDTIWS